MGHAISRVKIGPEKIVKPNPTPIAATRSKRALLKLYLINDPSLNVFCGDRLRTYLCTNSIGKYKIFPFHWMSNLHMHIFKFRRHPRRCFFSDGHIEDPGQV